jgi:type II secretory pathway predicted ATPase ExeA
MYADFFGLRELPFNNTPDPRFFYSTPDHEEALALLIYAVKERKGFVLLTGEVGAGKTLVSRMMLRHFGTSIAFANINHALHTAGDLMESLCSEFELPYQHGEGNAQLVRTLHDFLLAKFAQNTPVALLLDEAQNLPIEAFEQLRMIGNLEADDAKLLQIAIVGQPELQRLFQSPQLRQLKQRLFRSYHLPALDRKSTEGYVRYRLSVAAAKDVAIFAPRAVDRIYAVSGGLPRLINTVCDNAMLSAYSADRRRIDEDFLESVLAQMMLGGDMQTSRPALSFAASPPPSPPAVEPRFIEAAAASEPRAVAHTLSSPQRAAHRSGHARTPLHASAPVPAPSEQPSVYAQPLQRTHSATTSSTPRREVRTHGAAAIAQGVPTGSRADGSAAAVAGAGAVRTALEAITGQAKVLIGQGEALTRDLQQREQRLGALGLVIKKVAGQLFDLLNRLEKASAQGRRDQIAAQQTHDQLTIQTHRARQNADELARLISQAAARADAVRAAPVLIKVASAPVVSTTVTRNGDSVPADAGTIERMLSNTRDSLSELRGLARGSNNGRAAAANLEPHAATRLVQQVQGLLDMVEPAAQAEDRDGAGAQQPSVTRR